MFTPIWLPKKEYAEFQTTYNTIFSPREGCKFCAAEFKRDYRFGRDIDRVRIEVSGDTRFYLWLNGEHVCAGPVAEGGDYANTAPMKKHYYTEFTRGVDGRELRFYARAYIGPDVMNDYSQGRGAFMLNAEVSFSDGSSEIITTGEDWSARRITGQSSVAELDDTLPPDEFTAAERVDYPDILVKSPLPPLHEEYMPPQNGSSITVPAGETAEFDFTFGLIWAGYLTFSLECVGKCDIEAELYELKNTTAREHITACKALEYRSLRLQSIGGCRVTFRNDSDSPASISRFGQIVTYYPTAEEGNFVCSDRILNSIYGVAKHTLKICRQSLHLDSPVHQETLGCTGDYNIESLMNYFTFGDPRLTRLDVIRTADWLRQSGGFMFHTSYSLIWLQMARDYVLYSGDARLIGEIFDAAEILLARFDGYTDKTTGLIENPPNYMFIDWVNLDGFNMHHPPKNAGQTALNAFYYEALGIMAEFCAALNRPDIYTPRAQKLKESFEVFYDAGRGLYYDGKNDKYEPNQWLPPDNGKRYFSKQANSLAVLYGLCPEQRRAPIMERVVGDDAMTDVQPYFMFYLLGALDKAGLFEKYGLSQLHRFDILVRECGKGLREGWGEFQGDYSHAWGGCAAYYLPKKALGFEMLEPGFKKIRLSPTLLGLEYAEASMPTPYGMIKCSMKRGEKPLLEIPAQIEAEIF